MRRRELRRRMRGLVIAVLMVLAFLSGFFGRTLVSAYAEEEYIKPVKRYYTSIQLQAGDSLWDIAEEYMDGSGYSKKEYVEVLKRMNGLSSDRIHAGQYLTVGYFAE